MKKRLVLVVLVLLLAGCDENEKKVTVEIIAPVENTQTVEWYLGHEVERITKLEECNSNPGTLKDSANCQNATSAGLQLSAGKLRTVQW